MPKKELIHQELQALKAPEKATDYFDTIERGLILRLSEAGSKTFSYRYRFGGKNKQYKIGRFPDISLAEARKRLRELRQKVEDGIDPQTEKKKAKEKRDELNFFDLADLYIKRHLPELRDSTRIEYQRIIDKDLNPVLGKLPVNSISRKDIIDLLDSIAIDREAPVLSNRVRATLSSMYSFGIDKALIDSNPVLSIKKKKKTKDGQRVEKKRRRTYSKDEIKALWRAFSIQSEPVRSLFYILLLCGQRSGETRKMRWDYIDFNERTWTIPDFLTKAKRKHIVPLSVQAIEILGVLKESSDGNEFVFPNRRQEGKPIRWLQKAVERIRKLAEVKEGVFVSDFRVHDLRRTTATYMAELGTERTVLGKVLNHKELSGDNQVTAIYDRHDYLKEKREALQNWGNYLERIINEEKGNVLKLG